MPISLEDLIIEVVIAHPKSTSKEIHTILNDAMSYSSVKRILRKLVAENVVITRGMGKGTTYFINNI
jgi:predicted transcriptional regulator